MVLSRGDPMIFIEHPISAGMLGVAAALVLMQLISNFRQFRKRYFFEED
jgi:putative tricarboxylic transport membrane protein